MRSDQGAVDKRRFDEIERRKQEAYINAQIEKELRARLAAQSVGTPTPNTPAASTTSETKIKGENHVVKNVTPNHELVPRSKVDWTAKAKAAGFNSIDEVKAFQTKHGLVVDGKVGNNTLAKLAELKNAQVVPVQEEVVTKPNAEVGADASAQKPAPFNLQAFAYDHNLSTSVINGKTYARYDPAGIGDFWVGEDGTAYYAGAFGHLGSSADKFKPTPINEYNQYQGSEATKLKHYNALKSAINNYTPSQAYTDKQNRDAGYAAWEQQYIKANPRPTAGTMKEYETWGRNFGIAKKAAGYNKQGGTMNRINYFQQGGAAPKQDIKAQVTALVQAAMQGDQKATQQVNQIMETAKAGNQQAVQLAQLITEVAKQLQGQATSAKWGSKLDYIKSLKFAKGGKTCPVCEKKVEMKACGGKKAKKRYFGGII
jgi:peptidoglycan hydrolase-like protein with peptidoglycan-binding domain